MTDDGIKEIHGAKCREGATSAPSSVLVWESERMITLDGNSSARTLTPTQARYLARKLYRLARRIDRRIEAGTPS